MISATTFAIGFVGAILMIAYGSANIHMATTDASDSYENTMKWVSGVAVFIGAAVVCYFIYDIVDNRNDSTK